MQADATGIALAAMTGLRRRLSASVPLFDHSTAWRDDMANPWLKKNPFMSMWLSAFNTAAGSMRGHAMAQARRQRAGATKTVVDAWLGKPPARKKRRKKA